MKSLYISVYRYSVLSDIERITQGRNILYYQTLNRSQDTDICVLVDTRQIIGQIAGYSGQT